MARLSIPTNVLTHLNVPPSFSWGRFSELDSLSQDERIELSKAFIAPENVDSTIYVDSCTMISIEMLRTRCLVNVEDPSTVIGDIQQEFEQLKPNSVGEPRLFFTTNSRALN